MAKKDVPFAIIPSTSMPDIRLWDIKNKTKKELIAIIEMFIKEGSVKIIQSQGNNENLQLKYEVANFELN